MDSDIYETLQSELAKSTAAQRKQWASQIANGDLPLVRFLGLLHGHPKTAQRFTWLLGDIGELNPQLLLPCVAELFELRNEMPFPGMRRGVARWLELTNVPPEIEKQAIPQLLEWLADPQISIGCKHYSIRILFRLVKDGRVAKAKFIKVLETQVAAPTEAATKRMQATLARARKLP